MLLLIGYGYYVVRIHKGVKDGLQENFRAP